MHSRRTTWWNYLRPPHFRGRRKHLEKEWSEVGEVQGRWERKGMSAGPSATLWTTVTPQPTPNSLSRPCCSLLSLCLWPFALSCGLLYTSTCWPSKLRNPTGTLKSSSPKLSWKSSHSPFHCQPDARVYSTPVNDIIQARSLGTSKFLPHCPHPATHPVLPIWPPDNFFKWFLLLISTSYRCLKAAYIFLLCSFLFVCFLAL